MGHQNHHGQQGYDQKLIAGTSFGVLKQTLGATFTMDRDMPTAVFLDPGGAGRTVLLPPEEEGLAFLVANQADAAEALTVKEDSNTTTIGVLGRGEAAWFVSDGVAWVMGVSAYGGAGVAPLTEASGAIGGTNNSDIPSLTATAAALTGTLTGTANGSLADVAATASAVVGGATPSAAQVDTGIALAVSTIVSGVNEQLKELQAQVNALIADAVVLRAAARENAAKINELVG